MVLLWYYNGNIMVLLWYYERRIIEGRTDLKYRELLFSQH